MDFNGDWLRRVDFSTFLLFCSHISLAPTSHFQQCLCYTLMYLFTTPLLFLPLLMLPLLVMTLQPGLLINVTVAAHYELLLATRE